MEYYECLNILKDTENALFRECEKIVKLEAELARKDEEIARLKQERTEIARKALEGIDDYWRTLPENQAFMTELDALAGEEG